MPENAQLLGRIQAALKGIGPGKFELELFSSAKYNGRSADPRVVGNFRSIPALMLIAVPFRADGSMGPSADCGRRSPFQSLPHFLHG